MESNNKPLLYSAVADEIRKKIASGEYSPGMKIPSHAELVKIFGVSPITIRRALQELMLEGLVYGHQGRGVFVTDQKRIVRVLTSSLGWPLGNDIARAGYKPSIDELSYEVIEPKSGRTKLQGQTVHRHEKRIFADGTPIAVDVVHLPSGIGAAMREDLREKFVFSLIAQLDVPVSHVEFEIQSTFATEYYVERLNILPRSPLVVASYCLYDDRNQPIMDGHTVARSDRMVFALTVRVGDDTGTGEAGG